MDTEYEIEMEGEIKSTTIEIQCTDGIFRPTIDMIHLFKEVKTIESAYKQSADIWRNEGSNEGTIPTIIFPVKCTYSELQRVFDYYAIEYRPIIEEELDTETISILQTIENPIKRKIKDRPFTLQPWRLEFCDKIFDRTTLNREIMTRGEEYRVPDTLKIAPIDKEFIQNMLLPLEEFMNTVLYLDCKRLLKTLTRYYSYYIIMQYPPPYLRLLPIEKLVV